MSDTDLPPLPNLPAGRALQTTGLRGLRRGAPQRNAGTTGALQSAVWRARAVGQAVSHVHRGTAVGRGEAGEV